MCHPELACREFIERSKDENKIRTLMSDTAINILWTIGVGTFVLLLLAVGFIMAIVQGKRREMTAKQREMEELAKREKKYRNLFENSLAGMVRISSNTWDVLDANRALLEMLGARTAEEVKQIFGTIPMADRDQILTTFATHGTIKNLEVTVQRFDTTEVCISFSGTLFSDEGYIEGVLIDVTEQKRLEAKQLRAQRIESIGVLASGMAHDLKNLLVPVKMSAELLQRKYEDKKSRSMLTSIGENAEHSINLVQQVLAFVRGVRGSMCR